MEALVVKNLPVNGVLYTQVFPYSHKLEEQLLREKQNGQTIVRKNFDLEKYKLTSDFV